MEKELEEAKNEAAMNYENLENAERYIEQCEVRLEKEKIAREELKKAEGQIQALTEEK